MPRFLLLTLLFATPAFADDAPFRIERAKSFPGPADYYYMQSRGALVPGDPPRVIVTTQEIEKQGAHGFRDVFQFETSDLGKTWNGPKRIDSLRRAKRPDGYEVVIGDLMPQWHARTGVVLATGKTFNFADGVKENRGREQTSYTVYSPKTDTWSGLNIVELPAADHAGQPITQPNAGCNQWVELPGGDILLPIRYCRVANKLNYTTIVARCSFDGATLKYLKHGSEFTIPKGRGLYEPSVVACGGKFYLTMRGDESAFVARSDDGLTYEPFVEWTFDDGKPLGSYNTQQHWVVRGKDLYLVYTRKGANNDHVFRHRAPLFIGKVDTAKLCVVRATEQILIPENKADIGNFGVVDVSPNETWIIASEQLANTTRKNERNETWVGKLLWAKGPVTQSAPGSEESDPRLHADGEGWRLDKAAVTDTSRPRVLLIGDSILNGYLKQVTAALKGTAYIDAWVTPTNQGNKQLPKIIEAVLANGPYDVIHFNLGLHGYQPGRIPEGKYEPLTKGMVASLRKHAPKATLIWASTTPITVKDKPTELDPEHNPTIVEHNRLAAKVMKEEGVPVNDLYALMAPMLEMARGDKFHWKQEGRDVMAKQVSAVLHKAIEERKTAK